MLTTNTDRALPNAFVRRCVVHKMPVREGQVLIDYLVRCGGVQFPEMDAGRLKRAAKLIADERARLSGLHFHCPPGVAEFIDLLTALNNNDELSLDDIAGFVLRKHSDT